jgi:hypothetical protein
VSDEIKALRLNPLAETFAMWTLKTFNDLKSPIGTEELKALLLDVGPESAKNFFLLNIKPETLAVKVYTSYNQWRLFLPVFVADDRK